MEDGREEGQERGKGKEHKTREEKDHHHHSHVDSTVRRSNRDVMVSHRSVSDPVDFTFRLVSDAHY